MYLCSVAHVRKNVGIPWIQILAGVFLIAVLMNLLLNFMFRLQQLSKKSALADHISLPDSFLSFDAFPQCICQTQSVTAHEKFTTSNLYVVALVAANVSVGHTWAPERAEYPCECVEKGGLDPTYPDRC